MLALEEDVVPDAGEQAQTQGEDAERDCPARADTDRALLALRGVGPWTAAYIAMRALADPDRFLPGDVAVRSALAELGLPDTGAGAASHASRWRPWRSYAVMHLWRSVSEPLEESA